MTRITKYCSQSPTKEHTFRRSATSVLISSEQLAPCLWCKKPGKELTEILKALRCLDSPTGEHIVIKTISGNVGCAFCEVGRRVDEELDKFL